MPYIWHGSSMCMYNIWQLESVSLSLSLNLRLNFSQLLLALLLLLLLLLLSLFLGALIKSLCKFHLSL